MKVTSRLKVRHEDGYTVLTIDHPASRNALTDELLAALADEAYAADIDEAVRAIVFAGSDRVFASGADIAAMATRTSMDAQVGERMRNWALLRHVRTPTIAAVSGFCLGGGAELAMMCDLIVASPTAKFGLPETTLGLLPGAGGTQMLPRAVGKAVALDMVLTGRTLSADEAAERGLISRVASEELWLVAAEELAERIASRSSVAQVLAKQAVYEAFESPISAGLVTERALFGIAVGSEDSKEGIQAFLEKREPRWAHR